MAKINHAGILEQLRTMLGVPENDVEKLPEMLREALKTVTTPPVVVSFAFNPATRQLLQIAVSNLPKDPSAYRAVAQATSAVAQEFNNAAVEVAKHVAKEDGVGEGSAPRRGDEPRVGGDQGRNEEAGGMPDPDGGSV